MKKQKEKFILILLIVLTFAVIISIIITSSKYFSKKVVCSSNATSNGITITQKYVIKYSKESITNITVNKSYEFSDKEQYKNFANVIDNTTSSIKSIDKEYIVFEVENKNNGYYTELDVDMKKATDDDLLTLGFTKKILELQSTLEEQGLICK